MKAKFVVISSVLVVAAVIIGYLGYTYELSPSRPGDTTPLSVIIPKNQTAGAVVDELATKGVIKSVLFAKIYFRLSGTAAHLQSGTFEVSAGQGLPEIIHTLSQKPKDVWVTIPEGWRREQIAERFMAELAGPAEAFSAGDFLTNTVGLEGQLFPDTYLVPREATALDIKKYLLDNFAARAGTVDRETLILASLVEREGKTDADRPVIAGILQNRLQARWPLQVDASLQYAQGSNTDWWPKEVNTKAPSLYNSYLHTGLPPTPICNPGLASINAAKKPTKTNYWYYLHGKDGVVHYAQTIQEHNANIDKYL